MAEPTTPEESSKIKDLLASISGANNLGITVDYAGGSMLEGSLNELKKSAKLQVDYLGQLVGVQEQALKDARLKSVQGESVGAENAQKGVGSELATAGKEGISAMLANSPLGAGGGLLAKVLLGKFAGDAAGALTENILTSVSEYFKLGLSPQVQETVGDAVDNAVTAGMILGPKSGLGAFVGTFVGAGINSLLSDQAKSTELGTVFGKTITVEDAVATGTPLLAAAFPKMIPMILSPLLTLLTGPVGLGVMVGAAIVGGAVVVGDYLEEKRKDFIKEIDSAVADGIAEISGEKDVGFARGLAVQMGFSDPTNTSEKLLGLEQTLSSYKTAVQPGGRGPLSPEMKAKSQVVDWGSFRRSMGDEATSDVQNQMKSIAQDIQKPGFLATLSSSQLDQLKRLSTLVGDKTSLKLIDEAINRKISLAESGKRDISKGWNPYSTIDPSSFGGESDIMGKLNTFNEYGVDRDRQRSPAAPQTSSAPPIVVVPQSRPDGGGSNVSTVNSNNTQNTTVIQKSDAPLTSLQLALQMLGGLGSIPIP